MGSVVISVDAELGWGFHDYDEPPAERVEAARTGWRHLADLFDEHRIPATWAVVGHLMCEDCDGFHHDHPAGPEWFGRERGEWTHRPDLRFGRDLIERLATAAVDHDVGCHTFSHVLFGSEDATRSVARAELERSLSAAREFGIDLQSFVFPRNDVGHLDLLADYGFDTYRGRNPRELSTFRKVATATVVEPDPRLVSPHVDEHGLVNVPASLYLFGFEGPAKRAVSTVFEDPIVRRARRGIDAAAGSDGVFHMWLHPNNLVRQSDVDRLDAILGYLDQRRGDVEIATMADVAADFDRATDDPAPVATEPSLD